MNIRNGTLVVPMTVTLDNITRMFQERKQEHVLGLSKLVISELTPFTRTSEIHFQYIHILAEESGEYL